MNYLCKSVRHVKPVLIFSLLLMMLFPYAVMAEEPEYQIPENSISYMAQANTTSQPFMSASEQDVTDTESASLQTDEQQYESPLFAEALSKMQKNKAHRQAEAERLGIVLPSKIQQTLKQIMTR